MAGASGVPLAALRMLRTRFEKHNKTEQLNQSFRSGGKLACASLLGGGNLGTRVTHNQHSPIDVTVYKFFGSFGL